MKNTNKNINEVRNASELVEELNAIRNTATAKDVNAKIAVINEQLKAESSAIQDARITELLTLDKVAMFTDFINKPCYNVVRLATDKESGAYKIVERERQLGFRQLEKAFAERNKGKKTLANNIKYYGMVANFAHNLCRNIAGELSIDSKPVTVPSFNGEKIVDFGGSSITALEAQLNAIAETILPAEICPKMLKADVKAIKAACVKEKMLVFTLQTENAIINKIFNAFKIRMNDEAYIIKSKARCHQVKTEKASKKTA